MRLGTILGIGLRVHPGWALVLVLLAAALASMLAGPGPGQLSVAAALLVAVVVSACLFLAIVVHELAHALVARRRGLPVSEVAIDLGAGAAGLTREPPTAATEALVAGAGPAVSIVAGLVFLAVSAALPAGGGEAGAVLRLSCWWLGLGNLLLALVNLVPSFPLDGGRLVRSALWAVSGDLVRATRWAALIGRIVGYLVVGAGLYLALLGEVLLGVWAVLVGWFMTRSARSAFNRIRLEQLTAGLAVADVMEPAVGSVGPSLTLDSLMAEAERDQDGGLDTYPVVHEELLVGALEIRRARRIRRRDWPARRVGDVMTPLSALATFAPTEPLMAAVTHLESTRTGSCLVVEAGAGDRLVGVVTREGVLRRLRSRQARLSDSVGSDRTERPGESRP